MDRLCSASSSYLQVDNVDGGRNNATHSTRLGDCIGVRPLNINRADFGDQTFWGIRISEPNTQGHGAGNKNELRNQKKAARRAALTSKGVMVCYNNLGPPAQTCQRCNAVVWYEERNNKGNKSCTPSFSICCQEGKVQLPMQQAPPEPLKTLLQYTNDPAATKFKQHIRIYNSMLCFTSFGAKIDTSINRRPGPYTFRISGQNYHSMRALMPKEGEKPTFAQLYFHDTRNEVHNRMNSYMNAGEKGIDEEVVHGLMKMLDAYSGVAKAFRMARDWCDENNSNTLSLHLTSERRMDSRQYNTPNVSEVAALIIGDFGQASNSRDILVQSKKSGEPDRISELHPLYMALQYPLLFPYGEDGYHEKIEYRTNNGSRKTNRRHVTMREFYVYRLHQRRGEEGALIRGGRLFHQYLVDAYSALEEQRLRFIRYNQKEIRADIYNNVCDAVARGDTRADAIGKRIVLPSSFTGSPRYMVQNYQDAMAICRVLGNPDLFITFTANPRWPEVENMLQHIPGQKTTDRPDVVTRVFKIKLDQLLTDFQKHEIFGKCCAALYTIEFQKRGLPHAHILLWLENADKCKSPAEINDIINAEIPCPVKDPHGHRVVTDFMLHGPCGANHKSAPCMSGGKCTKHFPKNFYPETTIDEDGFPVYRRRDNGIHVIKSGSRLDNRFVTPYNRYLLLRYEAHINVEWCNRSKAIKYLFKYLSKGPDRSTVVLQEKIDVQAGACPERKIEVDEIKQYLDCRYLSPCEAVWRIFAFDIHYSLPSVIRLPFHLEGENLITMHDSENLQAVMQRQDLKKTMFTEWMELNSVNEEARSLCYAEIPTRFVWHSRDKKWRMRKQGRCIGRIFYSHPTSGERYYLRLLLNVVKGPRSFREIRTIQGKPFHTFKEACYALGMINDDREWTDAISEAKQWAFASQLRHLFVTMLLFCEVGSPKQLWEQNWEALSEDILYRKREELKMPDLQLSEDQIKNYCLVEIQEILNMSGKSLSDFKELPMPDLSLLTRLDNRLIKEELDYDYRMMAIEHEKLHASLNDDQIVIYNKVIDVVHNDEGGFFFVNGAGGTGKTFLYKAIIYRLRSEKSIVLTVASSGIASLLLPGGRTAHSRFVIPIELMENSTCGITQNTHLAALLHEVRLIIWDEAPMTQRYAFEALDRTLKDILGQKDTNNRHKIFGGVPILLGGDFRQILPVIPKGKRADIIQACINKSKLWNDCMVFSLTRSMRVNEFRENGSLDLDKKVFNEWVLRVGDGKEPAKAARDEDEPTWIPIPSKFIVSADSATHSAIKKIVTEAYPDFEQRQYDEDYLVERAILSPLNQHADEINEYMFEMLHGAAMEFKSSDEICKASTDIEEQEQMYPVEFLNRLNFPNMPPHTLRLKEGLPVMLLRNVNPSQGLCNGTRMIVSCLGKWVIKAKLLTGSGKGKSAFIPRITLTSPKTKWPFIMKRRQFPLKPCFAMTINKSQGQSLNVVGLYLPKPVFCHGQLYVALSRVTDPKGLKILIQQGDIDFTNHTKNIVFKEAFYNLA